MSTATTASAAPAARSDFPTWLPPMLVKELRQGLRTRGFVGAFVIFQLVMALMMIGTITTAQVTNEAARLSAAGTVNALFWGILAAQFLFVTPARALGSLQMEADSRTLDLLLLTRLSAWRIVVGKWASLMAQAGLLLIAMLPYGIVRYFAASADLVEDAQVCAALLGGCAVATAMGLWASGLPKLVRILAPVAMVFFGLSWQSLARSTVGVFSGGEPWLWCLDGALVLVFFLVTAVRRIAPAAESHVLLARGLPLLALLPVPILAWAGPGAGASLQWGFAVAFLAVVCAVELASLSKPMAAHWWAWARKGWWGRIVGRLVLPGWPSGLLYTLLVTGLIAVTALQNGVVPIGEAAHYVWMVMLGLVALVAPVIVLSFGGRAAARAPGGVYILTFGALSTFGAIAWGLSQASLQKFGGILPFARVLPGAGFWLSLGRDVVTTEVGVGQALFGLIVILIVFAQSMSYWKQLAVHEVRERLAKP